MASELDGTVSRCRGARTCDLRREPLRLRSASQLLVAVTTLSSAGCATPAIVANLTHDVVVDPPDTTSLSARVASLEQEQTELAALAELNGEQLAAAAALASMSEVRIAELEESSGGTLGYEVVYAIDEVPFESGSAALSPATRSLLDQLAERLLVEGVGRWVEVHGGGAGSLGLAQERADAIRGYLHDQHGLPLHRVHAVAGDWSTPPGGAAVVVLRQARASGGGR